MSAKNIVVTVLPFAAAIGMAVWFAAEHQARLRLVGEHQTMESQLNEMTALLAQNNELSNVVARTAPAERLADDQLRELLRLRGEVGVLRRQTGDLESVRDENRRARAGLGSGGKTDSAPDVEATADYWPRDSWTFSGYANADAALQSTLWAANSGDLKTLMAGATPDVQKLMEATFTGKSETESTIRAMDQVLGFKSARILKREAQGDDAVMMTTEFEGPAGTRGAKLLMKRVGSEWKLAGID